MIGTAYIVDDDEAIRDALTWLFKSRQVTSRAWHSAEAFLADWRDDLVAAWYWTCAWKA